MSIHRNSAFKNACIKMPIHPASRRPVPHFERPTIVVNSCESSPTALGRQSQQSNSERSARKSKTSTTKNVTNLVDFIESIPDYKDVNHLSKQEFYGKLDLLKKKQAELNSACFVRNFNASTIPENDDHNKQQHEVKYYPKMGNRSKSASPFRSTPLFTIPEPFQMTQREDEETMLEDSMMACKSFTPSEKQKTEQPQRQLKPSAIPVTSRYPMYKDVLAAQARRSQLAKLNSAIELQAQMKPFSFTDKITTEPHHSCSPNPADIIEDDQRQDELKPATEHCFRAKPCPKNLFSNYFYHKMWEDEYFRALNRKLRAEELLKMSSLPPSMRRREHADSDVFTCSSSVIVQPVTTIKSERTCSAQSSKRGKRRSRRLKKKTDYCHLTTKSVKDPDFITTCPQPFEFETAKRSTSRKSKKQQCSSASTGSTSKAADSCNPSPQPMYPAARPNLAANLRMEWAQQKLCKLSFGPEKTFPKEKLQRPNWGVRKSPAWKTLYYDNTNDEDISLRLATRRAEQKLRQEEHQINMELMRQRVRAAPLLLEGPTQWGTTMDSLRHNCRQDDEERMLEHQKQERRQRSSRNQSKLSMHSGKSFSSSCINDDCDFESTEKTITRL